MDEQSKFEGWAILELMGHRREIGFVTTEHYGAASLFRVDSPEFEEREYELARPEWVRTEQGVDRLAPIGSKVRRPGIPARSCLVGPGSIYALNPCTEETARKAIEQGIHRPLILLSVPERAQITGTAVESEELGDRCVECGSLLQFCECG
jgi:hypothetical protein